MVEIVVVFVKHREVDIMWKGHEHIDEWAELAGHLPILCIHVNATSLLQYKQAGSDSLWHFFPQEFGYDDTRHVALPSPSELMALLYRWQVCRGINKKRRSALSWLRE